MDQRPRIDGVGGDYKPPTTDLLELGSLLMMARKNDAGDPVLAGERFQALQEETVLLTVVERPARGGAGGHQDRFLQGQTQFFEDARVWLKVTEVKRLLQPGVAAQLGGICALAPGRLGREGLGHQHHFCESESQVVRGLVLEVHRRDGRDAERPSRDDLGVGVVGERDVWSLVAGP